MTDTPFDPAAAPPAPGERIAKRLARAGIASRREAERLIEDGRVMVDGVVLASPALVVGPGADIRVDGQPIPADEATRLFRYHKPAGLIVTRADPQGRPTIFERLPPELPRLVSVGRLDLTSEGLLLLTNDGELARALELPATGWIRRYRARAYGKPKPEMIARLQDGITVDGIKYGPIEAKLDREQGDNVWITLALREGKNREVRKALEYFNLEVNRLIRTAYGPFLLGQLPPGGVEEVAPKAIRENVGGLRAKSQTPRADRPTAGRPQSRRPTKR